MLLSVVQAILVGIIIGGTALFFLRRYIPLIAYGAACKKWPHATGKIIEAPQTAESPPEHGYRMGRGPLSVRIRYAYRVGEKEYEGDNVSFDPEIRGNSAMLRKVAELYEKDGEVVVYYNPKRPGISVLRP